eukprot:TRINITY_DN19054_c0_g1_i1.p1 TRINITY_DN19054_c0_g1~~TRINITY_DN19054_c0_g1_i1.p1  ORF type:complete len:533 (+),score=114.95 TRINITY_DN19054_c0_g1_i1:87-1685(+)
MKLDIFTALVALVSLVLGLVVHPYAAALVLVIHLLWWLLWRGYDPLALKPADFQPHFPLNPDYEEPQSTEEKFLVIGAGFVGLGMAASLQRNQIPFDVMEQDDGVGGNWKHGVYETVHIISSRLTTEYKDYPMDSSAGDFPSAQRMLEYFKEYAAHYGFDKRIKFGHTVTKCDPIDATGTKWRVRYRDAKGAEEKEAVYKGVIVAIGHHWDSRIPEVVGREGFTGEVIHSKQYHNHSQLDGKRVLVVGAGNSACDIAVESARFSSETHLSIRRGRWFLPRSFLGIPLVEFIQPWHPMWFQRITLKFVSRFAYGPFRKYNVPEPDHAPFDTHPTINSELLHYVHLGEIQAHPNIQRFVGGRTVEFEDGQRRDVDLVIFCTGYHMSLPMLQHLIPYRDGVPQLIQGSLTPWRNLYVVIGGQVRYGAGPIISLGAHLLALNIKMQERLRHPLGLLVHRVRGKASIWQKSPTCADVLTDPHEMTKVLRQGMRQVRYLPVYEKALEFMGTKQLKVPQCYLDFAAAGNAQGQPAKGPR